MRPLYTSEDDSFLFTYFTEENIYQACFLLTEAARYTNTSAMMRAYSLRGFLLFHMQWKSLRSLPNGKDVKGTTAGQAYVE